MAVILVNNGDKVENLFLLDSVALQNTLSKQEIKNLVKQDYDWRKEDKQNGGELLKFKKANEKLFKTYVKVLSYCTDDILNYIPSEYNGDITFFKATKESNRFNVLPKEIKKKIISKNLFLQQTDNLSIIPVKSDHYKMLEEKPRSIITSKIREKME